MSIVFEPADVDDAEDLVALRDGVARWLVDRAHAGSGLGDAALTYSEHQIRDRGGTVARLDAVASNVALHAWYEHRGYRRVSRTTFGEQDVYDAVLFEKPLT